MRTPALHSETQILCGPAAAAAALQAPW